MNIHLPAILGFTRYQGFDPYPHDFLSNTSLQEPSEIPHVAIGVLSIQMVVSRGHGNGVAPEKTQHLESFDKFWDASLSLG